MSDISPTPSRIDPRLPADLPTELFIGGAWRPASTGAIFDVLDPATGLVLASVADAVPGDGMAALDVAAAAQGDWERTPARTRAEILWRAWRLVQERREELATVISLEMGKPLAEADGEVSYGGEFLRWFSEEAVRVAGRFQASPEGHMRQLITRRPVGPCLFITPWNFPLAMGTRKIAPALAAGCTVVLKPAVATPLTSLLLAQILVEAGVPAGVVNVVPTATAEPLTGPLIKDPRLRKLSFTGSTAVGRALLREASEQVLRTSMELGGNAPFLVFEDAHIDEAVEGAHLAKMRNMGEACTAANRFIVHESVAEEFTTGLAERFASLTVGAGMGPGTDCGPLISDQARETVDEVVRSAIADGATVVTGGRVPDGPGFFYPPTVLGGVPADARILSQEIFGPVAPVVTFSTEAEAVRMANDSEVGLAGYVYTRDMDRILRLAEVLQVGMIGVNQGVVSNAAAPFGGMKQSGMGREGGAEGIEEFLETVDISLPDPFRS